MRGTPARLVLALAVFALVFLFRFNTLSGDLGGFDNDHFINLARGNQLLAGDWPLRDYPDASLQGAWPPLTYLASAGAQLVFGRTLLAEAVLSTAAVALGATLTTFAAANLTGSLWWGFLAAVLSVLPSIKLYGYARPLLFAAGLLLIFRCLDRPSRGRHIVLAVLLAIAFLFRHDYAVYLAIGWTVASLVRARREPGPAIRDLVLTGVATLLLLLPTLVLIQTEVGFDRYVASARALAQDEFNRTNLRWPAFDTVDLSSPLNSIAWLYYVFLALPAIAAVTAVWRARRGSATPQELEKVIALAAVAFLANRFLLRGNVEARLADAAVFAAILGVWLLYVAFARPATVLPRPILRGALRVAALAVVVVSVLALGVVGVAANELATSKLREGPLKTLERTALVWSRLAAEPPEAWSETDRLDGAMLAAAYVSTCTSDTDRLLITTSAPEVFVYGRRLFAAGHVDFVVGFYGTPEEQSVAVEQAKRQSIPIVLTEPEADHDRVFATEFAIVDRFIRERYKPVGVIDRGGTPYLRVLARGDLMPAGEFGSTGLPCYRSKS